MKIYKTAKIGEKYLEMKGVPSENIPAIMEYLDYLSEPLDKYVVKNFIIPNPNITVDEIRNKFTEESIRYTPKHVVNKLMRRNRELAELAAYEIHCIADGHENEYVKNLYPSWWGEAEWKELARLLEKKGLLYIHYDEYERQQDEIDFRYNMQKDPDYSKKRSGTYWN
jgi:hypothetical protein